MHEVFANAVEPKARHACLRLTLKPLTLGHSFFLHEVKSPFVCGQSAAWNDLLLAVITCACETHKEARKALSRPGWYLQMLGRYWGWRCQGMDLKAEFERFQTYLDDEFKRPPTNNPPAGQGRSVGTPWEWLLLERLMSDYHMTKDQALDCPIRTAACLWSVRADWEGKIDLATASNGSENLIHALWARAKERAAQMANN